jgi:riboflavin transporter FmnP
MDKLQITRLIISLDINLLSFVIVFVKCKKDDHKIFTTKFITRVAIFSAISTILYIVPYLKFPVPFFPSFLEIHFDEIPALIAGFAYGPLAGFFVILIKTIIKLPLTSTLCVGEIADLIYGLTLVIPASLIYKNKRTLKNAFIGLGVSTLIQVVVSSFLTTFVMLDFYIFVMGFSKEALLGMCQAANPNITSLSWPFLLMVGLPFNLFKDILLCFLTALLYKRLHRLIDRL